MVKKIIIYFILIILQSNCICEQKNDKSLKVKVNKNINAIKKMFENNKNTQIENISKEEKMDNLLKPNSENNKVNEKIDLKKSKIENNKNKNISEEQKINNSLKPNSGNSKENKNISLKIIKKIKMKIKKTNVKIYHKKQKLFNNY